MTGFPLIIAFVIAVVLRKRFPLGISCKFAAHVAEFDFTDCPA